METYSKEQCYVTYTIVQIILCKTLEKVTLKNKEIGVSEPYCYGLNVYAPPKSPMLKP